MSPISSSGCIFSNDCYEKKKGYLEKLFDLYRELFNHFRLLTVIQKTKRKHDKRLIKWVPRSWRNECEEDLRFKLIKLANIIVRQRRNINEGECHSVSLMDGKNLLSFFNLKIMN